MVPDLGVMDRTSHALADRVRLNIQFAFVGRTAHADAAEEEWVRRGSCTEDEIMMREILRIVFLPVVAYCAVCFVLVNSIHYIAGEDGPPPLPWSDLLKCLPFNGAWLKNSK
jgi:hypothetical protein